MAKRDQFAGLLGGHDACDAGDGEDIAGTTGGDTSTNDVIANISLASSTESTGNDKILLTERGTSFGYNTLVADMRGLPTMAKTGYPVIMDATHSVQQPGGQGGTSGGQREFVPHLARAAASIGIAAMFMETHPDPDNAPSDGPNMIPMDQFEALLEMIMKFDRLSKSLN